MTTTATFLTEFRSSMTFEYKAASDLSQTELVSNMTPQHAQSSLNEYKSPEVISEVERSSDMQHSPGSSRGTSLASSPALPIESASINTNGMSQDYAMRNASMEYPSSDDSVSMPNDMSGYNGDQDDMPSPLAQLQCALEKNGMIGKKLDLPVYPGADGQLLSREHDRNGTLALAMDDNMYDGEMYKCHLCSYSSNSKMTFNNHMNSHFDHKCPFCDYTSRTEGRLKRHVKDFHSETPPESWAGTRVPRNDGSGGELSMDDSVSSSGNNKPRTYRCKQCGFVAYKKNDFWEHNKTHIKAEKLLTCPQCNFVTEYKHHLEYHIRNHFGSKPFKCGKCNYSCVNKSMLNSHMKSHSNVYQYRCSNCSYATKYCHSLKLHLRKYDHKPASVLNVDGTPNPYPVIDVYGTRRGPRPKKRKFLELKGNAGLKTPSLALPHPNMNYNTIAPMMPSNMPVLYPPQMFNGYHNNMLVRPPMNGEHYRDVHPQGNPHFGLKSPHMKCLLCEFTTEHQDVFHKHMLVHAAKDNQDLIKLYGITSETILQMHEHNMAFNNMNINRQMRENDLCRFDMENKEIMSQKLQDFKPQIADSFYSVKTPPNSFERELNLSSQDGTKENFNKQLVLANSSPKNNSEDNDFKTSRSVIVSHKTVSPKPTLPDLEQDLIERESAKPVLNLNVESSPLDLSSAKTNDSRSPTNDKDNEDASCSSNEIIMNMNSSSIELSPNSIYSQSAQNVLFDQPRNRRKGKAFKLDRYLQVDDQASPVTTEPNRDRMLQERQSEEVSKPSPNAIDKHGQNTARDSGSVATLNNNVLSDCRDLPKFLMTSTPKSSSTFCVPEEKPESRVVEKPPMGSLNVSVPENYRSTQQVPNSRNASPGVPLSVAKIERDCSDVSKGESKWQDVYMCTYCDMAFRDCVMYTMHMGYHGYADPFTCNMCGYESNDKVEFFLHIARAAHT